MNKTELVAAMAVEAGISKRDAEKALSAFVKTVETEVTKGNSVQLIGFGTFSKAHQSERTGFGVTSPAKDVPKFKAGKSFKDMVAGK